MLKTAFIGNENFFDRMICEWLSEHTDLRLIIWTSKLHWSYGKGLEQKKRIASRFIKRAKQKGVLRSLDEMLYFALYRKFLMRREYLQLKDAVGAVQTMPRKPLSEIKQIVAEDIKSPELQHTVESLELDALFAMCIDVYLPSRLIETPRYGSFLWHEGITPEYRGVHSPFWALVNKDYDNLGYTLLRMNKKLDAGEIYVQGRVNNIDWEKDWHSYIGHKAIIDSLPEVKEFLIALERNEHRPLYRDSATDGYYSYPTGSALLQLTLKRLLQRSGRAQMPTQA